MNSVNAQRNALRRTAGTIVTLSSVRRKSMRLAVSHHQCRRVSAGTTPVRRWVSCRKVTGSCRDLRPPDHLAAVRSRAADTAADLNFSH